MRGGARPGSGPKRKALTDKIANGTADGATVLQVSAELEGSDMPPVKDFMKAAQKGGEDFCAEEVYVDTWNWLKSCRWISVELFISETGYLARHPTTGNAIASPYVSMSRDYMKQVNQCWYQIYQIVRENCSAAYGASPQDDLMERLLTARKGKA